MLNQQSFFAACSRAEHYLDSTTDMSNVSCLNQVSDGAYRIFNGDVWVEPGRPIDIDVVGAEALQRLGQIVLHGHRTGVNAIPPPLRVSQSAEFDAQYHRAAVAASDCFPDQKLIVTAATEVGRVEQCNAGIQGCLS